MDKHHTDQDFAAFFRSELLRKTLMSLRCASKSVCFFFIAAIALAEVHPVLAKDDKKTRDFYEVLEDVLADFEYDLKNGDVNGLRSLSIRNIAISENVPVSFKDHLELMLAERILQTTKTQIIKCSQCRARKASVDGNQVVIQDALMNPEQIAQTAKLQGIKNFMDAAFTFQSSGLILSLYIVDSTSSSIVWSRSYNSETSRASAFRRGVDYSQIEEPRQYSEYKATLQYRPVIYYLFQPTVDKYVGTLTFGFRLMERYNKRKNEVGFEANYMMDSGYLIGAPSTSTGNIYKGFNIGLMFVHAWNFIGDMENYNNARGGLFVAAGGIYSVGYLGAILRTGWEWRFGKHWLVSTAVGYRPPGSVYSSGSKVGRIHGAEFGIGVGALF